MDFLRTLAWLIAIVYSTIPSYWLLVHPHIEWWRARHARLMMVGPLWFLLWILTGAITRPWRGIKLYTLPWLWLPAVVLILIGLWIYSRARQDFGADQVLGRSELQPDRHLQRLNTQGIRARVRHPYYLGHFCELLGWTLGTGLLVLYALTAVALVTGAIMLRLEDAELEHRFGEPYRSYRQSVPTFFPRLWRQGKP